MKKICQVYTEQKGGPPYGGGGRGVGSEMLNVRKNVQIVRFLGGPPYGGGGRGVGSEMLNVRGHRTHFADFFHVLCL